MAGRPKAFDRDDALYRAMCLFWGQGYEATGLRDLLAHMDIGRQSLYDTFGNKHDLYLEALKRYEKASYEDVRAQLTAPGSAIENVHAWVRLWAKKTAYRPSPGCMINNAAVELSRHDQEVAAIVQGHLHKLENVLAQTLEQAQAAGELRLELQPRPLARFLISTLEGMLVLAKAGEDQDVIQDVVDVTIAVLQ